MWPIASLLLATLFGVFGGLLSERFKGGLAAIDSELARLDRISDEITLAVNSHSRGFDPTQAMIRVTVERDRLGKNLTRLFGRTTRGGEMNTALSRLATCIAKIEDAFAPPRDGRPPVDVEEAADLFEDAAATLRRCMRAAAKDDWLWRFFRK